MLLLQCAQGKGYWIRMTVHLLFLFWITLRVKKCTYKINVFFGMQQSCIMLKH